MKMSLVFVHGVSVRKGPIYAQQQESRDSLFREFALTAITPDTDNVTIENPYWGQYGATLAWNSASLPDTRYEDLGEGASIFEQILSEFAFDIQAPAADKILLTLAQESMVRAVDCLWTAGAYTSSASRVGPALASLSKRALNYAK